MQIEISQRAEQEIQDAHDWWARHRSATEAARWYRGIRLAIQALCSGAEQYPLIPEHESFSIELRQLVFGLGRRPTHRIVFLQRDDAIVILTVRHLARRELTAEDVT